MQTINVGDLVTCDYCGETVRGEVVKVTKTIITILSTDGDYVESLPKHVDVQAFAI